MKAATGDGLRARALAGFQSTPPVKAATRFGGLLRLSLPISIHAAREGGDDYNAYLHITACISIHAAREGGDGHADRHTCRRNHFNPRRP